MAEFVNPFTGMIPDRKLNDRELARAIRMALAAEEEAIHMYEAMADASDNLLAAEVLQERRRRRAGPCRRVPAASANPATRRGPAT